MGAGAPLLTLGTVHAGATALILRSVREAVLDRVGNPSGKTDQPLVQRSGGEAEAALSSVSKIPQGALVKVHLGANRPERGTLPPDLYFELPYEITASEITAYQFALARRRLLRDQIFLAAPGKGNWKVPLVPRETFQLKLLNRNPREYYSLRLGGHDPNDLSLNRVTWTSPCPVGSLAASLTPAIGLTSGIVAAMTLFGLLRLLPGPGFDEYAMQMMAILGTTSGLAAGIVRRESTAPGRRGLAATAAAALAVNAVIMSGLLS